MGMQVAQDKAEHGELGDRVVQALAAGKRVDHPAGPEPPPAVGEGPGARIRSLKALDSHPLPESAATPALQMHELHGPFQVSGQEDQHRGRAAEYDARFEAAARQPNQVVDQSKDAHGHQPRHQGQAQIVAHAGGDTGQLAQEGHHEMAEVVVADGIPRQPGVLGREEPALEHRGHEP